ncbi:MAG: transporter substrate-binding domain-containing protein [Lachnospiraceae bacterium]|nr:transporter substrate-binding domain-containing protein [Lachnospiraceae bacterium]
MIRKILLTGCLIGMMAVLGGCQKTDTEVSTDNVTEREPEETKDRLKTIEKTEKILIGISPDYAPFAFSVDQGDGSSLIAGADVELGRYLAEGLGAEVVFCEMEFEECLKAVEERTVDMVLLGMLPKAERRNRMDFTDAYYVPGKQVVMVQKSRKMEFSDKESLKEKTLAAQYGTLQAQLITEQLPESYMQLSDDVAGAVLKLRMGAVDGIVVDLAVAEELVKQYTDITVSSLSLEWVSEGIVAGVVKEQPQLLAKINELLLGVQKEKLYYEWLDGAHKQAASLSGK